MSGFITKEELAACEEANLSYPGSRFVPETARGYDEGQGWGFDALQRSAMVYREWIADAEPDEILHWAQTQLTARGWTVTSDRRRTRERP